MASFAEATAVKAIDSRTYSVCFHDAWAIGSVPHGGIVTSNILAVAKLHFATTLASYNQPHSITLHLEFLRRTSIGPAIVTIQNVKLGRRTSTVHVVLTQQPFLRRSSDDRGETPTTCIVGYITQSNITRESGISLSTNWTLSPPAAPLSSIAALRTDQDPHWALQQHHRFPKFRKAHLHVKTYLPRKGQVKKSVVDEWLCFSRDGARFTQESLGYVADTFPQLAEHGYAAAEVEAGLHGGQTRGQKDGSRDVEMNIKPAEKNQAATFWYPTILLNLDVKKALPEEGVEFLFVRVMSKQIRNGRLDLEVIILDESGELVATSTHVVLVMGSERNIKRGGILERGKL
ncbi:MAG: hypothetical protein Q9191_001771 [Dirinaria sp. TL-2023a]